MRPVTAFRRLLPVIVLAHVAGGCFSGMVREAAEEQRGPVEFLDEPSAVFVAADGALAIEARARFVSHTRPWADRMRYVVIEPAALGAKFRRAASSRHLARDADGRVIVEVSYPDGTSATGDQVIPGEFGAPGATELDLPVKFRRGTRIDWATAPRFDVSGGRGSHRIKGLGCHWEGRRFVLVLMPAESGRTGPRKGGVPIEAVLGPPALVLDVLTFPIQLPVYLIAFKIMVG